MRNLHKVLPFVMTVASATAPATAAERVVEGVSLPETCAVAGKTLALNGAGLRTATIFNVRVWVGAFYAPAPVRSEADALASPGPLRFEFHFLRDVSQARGAEAWRWQFQQSNQHAYGGLAQDVETLARAFGPIQAGTVQAVELVEGESLVYEDGALKARIPGRDFQVAFLSMFFGPKPPMESLKRAFLGPA
jgi:hypothetical protein